MRILFALTYYRPYVSGVTIYIQRLAEALALRGHEVTVLTAQYDPALAKEELSGGVRIRRLPVVLKISKGVLMRGYRRVARELVHEHDVVILNLPNTPLEALILPGLARAAGCPTVVAYHCDVVLPKGWFNRLVQFGVGTANRLVARRVNYIVAYTPDYARHSPLLRANAARTVVIPPPIGIEASDPEQVATMRRQLKIGAIPSHVIGFAARLAAEKGIEHLLAALPQVEAELGPVRLLIAGEYERVIGEDACRKGLAPKLRAQGERVQLLGVLTQAAMASFYEVCDVTVLPSTNATESFGMVQIESMLCGTPVVASDLPGVRVPVQLTGMGLVVPPGEPKALAEAIIEVLRDPGRFHRSRAEIEAHFTLEQTIQSYETLLRGLIKTPDCVDSNVQAAPRVHLSNRDFLRDHLREVPAFRALLRSVECQLLKDIAPLQQPILDIGCGEGHFASMAFTSALQTGVDPCVNAIRRAARGGAYQHVMQADATHLPFADGAFQTVLANSSLEHIPDLDKALSEITRVLQPGGRLLITTPSEQFAEMLLGSTFFRAIGLHRLGRAYGAWFNRHSMHFHTDSPDTWRRRFNSLGLITEHCRYYFTPQAHHAFDLAHYLSLPRLLSYRLTGNWMPLPSPLINRLFYQWLKPHVNSEPQPRGAYLFLVASKP